MNPPSHTPHFYRGEYKCEATCRSGRTCSAKASYANGTSPDYHFYCGRHQPKLASSTATPLAPRAHTVVCALHHLAAAQHELTRRTLQPPRIMLSTMPINGVLPLVDGFLNVYLRSRQDGISVPGLSPMHLGPVAHGQPTLPPAKTLQGFMLGNHWHRNESEEEFHQHRLELYSTAMPPVRKAMSTGEADEWLGVRWWDPVKADTPCWLTTRTSRDLYCRHYASVVEGTLEYQQLIDLMDTQGESLRICGAEAREMKEEDVRQRYGDESQSFSFEQVLFTMLLWRDRVQLYPWN